jgi:hypothetical protein
MTAGREELTREVASVHREDGLLDDRDFFKHTAVSPLFGSRRQLYFMPVRTTQYPRFPRGMRRLVSFALPDESVA